MLDKQVSVLVTAAGAEGTAGKILRLRRQGFRVVAIDADPRAPGLYLADRGHVVPVGTSPDFIPELRRICSAEAVRALVPLVDEELVPSWELSGCGLEVLLPRLGMVSVCLDKLALMETLDKAGIPVPPTRLARFGPGDLNLPLIVKPRTGRGSRGVTVVRTREELEAALAAAPVERGAMIIQEYVDGPEFSVSVVMWRDGRVQAVVPKEVVLKDGSSRYAISRRNEAVTRTCARVARALGADGPFNVQLRIGPDGVPRVFEINPRFSGSSTLTAAAGVDEIGLLLLQALDPHRPRIEDRWREGVAMVRHAAEAFVTEAELDTGRISLERTV
ncbi:ATP-grasp domain-containing protein [Nocardiopsis chromatogenes]|uniref:ATP-grasp domain-containing protein n=1 Tax=Nocardiopsis chromatogenes TaxID=280239 RepID=UPI00034C00E0|nr:ATP-grasp domain-containing protein [Nocardiopsis chromatogenes]